MHYNFLIFFRYILYFIMSFIAFKKLNIALIKKKKKIARFYKTVF